MTPSKRLKLKLQSNKFFTSSVQREYAELVALEPKIVGGRADADFESKARSLSEQHSRVPIGARSSVGKSTAAVTKSDVYLPVRTLPQTTLVSATNGTAEHNHPNIGQLASEPAAVKRTALEFNGKGGLDLVNADEFSNPQEPSVEIQFVPGEEPQVSRTSPPPALTRASYVEDVDVVPALAERALTQDNSQHNQNPACYRPSPPTQTGTSNAHAVDTAARPAEHVPAQDKPETEQSSTPKQTGAPNANNFDAVQAPAETRPVKDEFAELSPVETLAPSASIGTKRKGSPAEPALSSSCKGRKLANARLGNGNGNSSLLRWHRTFPHNAVEWQQFYDSAVESLGPQDAGKVTAAISAIVCPDHVNTTFRELAQAYAGFSSAPSDLAAVAGTEGVRQALPNLTQLPKPELIERVRFLYAAHERAGVQLHHAILQSRVALLRFHDAFRSYVALEVKEKRKVRNNNPAVDFGARERAEFVLRLELARRDCVVNAGDERMLNERARQYHRDVNIGSLYRHLFDTFGWAAVAMIPAGTVQSPLASDLGEPVLVPLSWYHDIAQKKALLRSFINGVRSLRLMWLTHFNAAIYELVDAIRNDGWCRAQPNMRLLRMSNVDVKNLALDSWELIEVFGADGPGTSPRLCAAVADQSTTTPNAPNPPPSTGTVQLPPPAETTRLSSAYSNVEFDALHV